MRKLERTSKIARNKDHSPQGCDNRRVKMQIAEDENDELQAHIENRRNVIRNLQQIYAGSVSQESDIDLLLELQPRGSQKCKDRVTCYRCKNLLNIPDNLLKKTYDKISHSTEEYETDIAFVQAIVWLKSTIESMKEVPAEQFHSVFHQQWNALRHNRDIAQTEVTNSFADENVAGQEDTNANLLSNTVHSQERGLNSCETRRRKRKGRHKETKSARTFAPIISSTPERRGGEYSKKMCLLSNCLIADTDDDYSSCSDMFEDFSQGEEADVDFEDAFSKHCKEDTNRMVEESLEENSTFSREDPLKLFSKNRSSNGQQSQCILNSDDGGSLTPDNSTFFDKISQFREGVSCLENEKSSQWISELINQKITPLSEEHSQALRERSQTIRQMKEIICQKDDSAYDTLSLDPFDQNSVPKEVGRSETFGSTENVIDLQQLSNNDEKRKSSPNLRSGTTYFSDRKNCVPSTSRKHEKCLTLTSQKVNAQGIDYTKNAIKEKKARLSSQWINFTLDKLNTEEVTLQSVKDILSVFEDEKIARAYMKRRYWTDTLEAEAINAVLNFCNIYEAKQRTNTCTQEIVRTITRTFDKIMQDTELNKVSLWMCHVSIIMEFCNSLQICATTIDRLIAKLKSYEQNVVPSSEEERDVCAIANQLHILFYALTICLKKYRLISANTRERPPERPITAVLDLWMKRLNNNEYLSEEESVAIKEQRWLTVLESFALASAEDFFQFAIKSRGLFRALSSLSDNTVPSKFICI